MRDNLSNFTTDTLNEIHPFGSRCASVHSRMLYQCIAVRLHTCIPVTLHSCIPASLKQFLAENPPPSIFAAQFKN